MNKKLKTTKKLVKKVTKPTLLEKELKSIKKLNKVFDLATPAEKRIIIAKDVIAQIELGKYIPTSGKYCESKQITKGKDLQSIILAPEFKCNVCELGGIFTSLIRIKDNFNTTQSKSIDSNTMLPELKKYFSVKQLSLIEGAFEGTGYGLLIDSDDVSSKKLIAAENYRAKRKLSADLDIIEQEIGLEKDIVNTGIFGTWRKHSKKNIKKLEIEFSRRDKEAMISICRNIINNKGTFRPER